MMPSTAGLVRTNLLGPAKAAEGRDPLWAGPKRTSHL